MDKEIYESDLLLEYDMKFPEINKCFKISHPDFGVCEVFIIYIGQYEWISETSVETIIKYYITDVIEPSRQYKINKLGLKVIGTNQ